MTDLESSFELLSTMSPKFKCSKTGKKLQKSLNKLSLKTNIRRSAIFDKTPHSHHVRDSSVIVLDDSVLSEKLSTKNVRIIKAPIIISSTSESENSDTDVKTYVNVQPKFMDIESWLSDNEKLDDYSKAYSPKNHSFSESDDEKINNLFISDKKKIVDDNLPSGTWQVVDIQTKLGKEGLRTSMAKNSTPLKLNSGIEDLGLNNSDNDIIDDCSDKYAEDLLDDIYGTSWRTNKDLILTRSEPRKKQIKSETRMPKTEVKSKKLEPKSLWQHRLKNLCDSDSEKSTSADSCKSTTGISDFERKLSFSDSDDSDIDMPKNVSRNNSFSSDINISENDNDSLGTRVKKKLTKKAKSITDQNKKAATKIKTVTNKSASLEKPIKSSKFNTNSDKYSFLKSLSGGVPPWKCHPDAQYFKSNFKTEKEALAKKLFDLYNKEIFGNVLPEDIPIQWNTNMRGTAGFCYCRRTTKRDGTVTRSCRIALATKVIDTADRLRDTLVHELCHAATWLVHNISDGHGAYWKSWAHKAMTTFPELPPIKRCHDYVINTKYTYKCTDCGYSIGRHSKSLDIERKRCGYCYGKFEIFINKVNKNGEKQTAPATPKGKPTGFALYVKENYGLVKRNDLKHGDVMKILGQQFSKMKLNQKV